MKVSFTGTRKGMTLQQARAFTYLAKDRQMDEFHHGDCIGSDENAHDIIIAYSPGTRIVIHPPDVRAFRAHCINFAAKREPLPYLTRNVEIVHEGYEALIATPKGREPSSVQAGGTWYTVRKARAYKVPIRILIYPTGDVFVERDNEAA